MRKIEGKKEPDRYELEMGLDFRAWTAEVLIKEFKEMPKNAALVRIDYHAEGDKHYYLTFEVQK